MQYFAKRPRLGALLLLFIGFVLTMVNYKTVRTEHNYYPMPMLFGPVAILLGIGGLIDPRVLNRGGTEAGRSQGIFAGIGLTIVLIGLGIGWAMAHYLYKIW